MNRILQAIKFATEAHSGQVRKGTKTPYIVHPLEVFQILQDMGVPDDVRIAGLLHDTTEDTPVTIRQIRENFGLSVAALVDLVTEDKQLRWEERKARTIDYLYHYRYRQTAYDKYSIIQLIFADKLSNLRSMAEDINIYGDMLWDRFKRGFHKQRWYYGHLLSAFEHVMPAHYYGVFNRYYNHVFEARR